MNWLIRRTLADLYPRTAELPGVEDVGLDAYLDRFRAEAPASMYAGVVAGAALYQASPIATVGKPGPAMFLGDEDRELHAQRLTTSDLYPVRQLVFLLKMVAGMCWGQADEVRDRLNLARYGGDPGTFRSE